MRWCESTKEHSYAVLQKKSMIRKAGVVHKKKQPLDATVSCFVGYVSSQIVILLRLCVMIFTSTVWVKMSV